MEAYPLYWPLNKKRTPADQRKRAAFHVREIKTSTNGISSYSYQTKKNVSLAEACNRVLSELTKYSRVGHPYRVLKDSIIISSNVPIKNNGLPYSGWKQPEDPGVAVYFTLDGKPYCLPCDKWDRVEDNVAAIAAHIAAMRGIERWGVGEAHDVFTGFKALPENTFSEKDIWSTLGLSAKPASINVVHSAYKSKAKEVHPDTVNGSNEAFHRLQEAYKMALKMYNL
ncbi:MAG: DnaJ domain-containing protein [Flavisolibacter sp.]